MYPASSAIVNQTFQSDARRSAGPLASRPGKRRFGPEFAPGLTHALELVVIALSGLGLFASPYFQPDYQSQHVFCIVFVVLCFAHLANWASLVSVNALMRPLSQGDNILLSLCTAFLFLLAIVYGLDVYYFFEPYWLGSFFGLAVGGVFGVRLCAYLVLDRLARSEVIGRNLAVLGTGVHAGRFLGRLTRNRPYFTRIVGAFGAPGDERPDQLSGVPVLGGFDDLLQQARLGTVDDIVVALPWSADRAVIEMIERLKELPVNVYLGSDLIGFDLNSRPVLGPFTQFPVFEVVQRPISGWSYATKLVLDYSVAALVLLVLLPLLMLVALAIRLESPGPVLFRQQRLGFNNKPFSIFKFRSMYHDGDSTGAVVQACPGDPRVTRVGRIIRATSIDELPQLLNVLNGTMSLVGPRPHAISHNEEYGRQIRGYFARHKVKPGITGWAQVNGLRGETRDLDLMRRRVEHDVYYTENWSIFFDVRILLSTVLVVLFQKAAY